MYNCLTIKTSGNCNHRLEEFHFQITIIDNSVFFFEKCYISQDNFWHNIVTTLSDLVNFVKMSHLIFLRIFACIMLLYHFVTLFLAIKNLNKKPKSFWILGDQALFDAVTSFVNRK